MAVDFVLRGDCMRKTIIANMPVSANIARLASVYRSMPKVGLEIGSRRPPWR